MILKGYKTFYKGAVNRYGALYEEGKTYSVDGSLQFGNDGNGIHFCKNLEDTLRYFTVDKDGKTVPPTLDDIDIAVVTSFEDVAIGEDNYNGYYDMYAARKIKIERVLTKEEILNMFLGKNTSIYAERVKRFLQTITLSEEEKELFKLKYESNTEIMNYLEYYQYHKKDVFEKKYTKK